MAKFEVLRATIDSLTGRQFKEGDIVEMEIPMVHEYDVRGVRIEKDPKPMKIGSNLRLIEEAKPAEVDRKK